MLTKFGVNIATKLEILFPEYDKCFQESRNSSGYVGAKVGY